MKIRKIARDQLDLFASVLPAYGEVHAPVRRGSGYAFERPNRWSEVCLEYPRTILPPRKFVLPPREDLFAYDEDGAYGDLRKEAARRIVLLGVHAYDIYGLTILDRVFLEGRYADPYYRERRRNLVVIGVDFEPDDKHFARSMNADFVDSGFDLFLSDIGESYLVLVGTSRGDDITVTSGCLLEDPTEADIVAYKQRSALRRSRYRTHVELGDLPEILEMEYRSHIWEELGEACLSCGACSMVCPTCYCFDVADSVALPPADGGDPDSRPLSGRRPPTGRRSRTWDSCLFRTHALTAGGENFREARSSRVRFRYYHKQRGFAAEYGRPSCVGCGRCSEACPAGIDIVSVIAKVRGGEHGTGVGEPAAAWAD